MEKTKTRIAWLDALKGFGIVCVVLSHLGIPGVVRDIIYLFHMPLFFMISGFLFSEEKLACSVKAYTGHIAKRLLWPYFCFGLLEILLYGIRYSFSREFLYKQITSFLYSNYLYERNYVGTIWFLTALFSVEMYNYIIRKYVRKQGVVLVLFAALTTAGLLWSKMTEVRLPLHLEVACAALGFYELGYESKKHLYGRPVGSRVWFWVLVFLAGIAIGEFNVVRSMARINMLYRRYGNALVFFVSTSMICISLLMIFHWMERPLERLKGITFLGRNSLVVMAVHMMIIHIIGFVGEKAGLHEIPWFILFVFCMTFSVLAVLIINKWFRNVFFFPERKKHV